jgi:hypothetical protein
MLWGTGLPRVIPAPERQRLEDNDQKDDDQDETAKADTHSHCFSPFVSQENGRCNGSVP